MHSITHGNTSRPYFRENQGPVLVLTLITFLFCSFILVYDIFNYQVRHWYVYLLGINHLLGIKGLHNLTNFNLWCPDHSITLLNRSNNQSQPLCLGTTSSPIITRSLTLTSTTPLQISQAINISSIPHIPKAFNNFLNCTFSLPQLFFVIINLSPSQTFLLTLLEHRTNCIRFALPITFFKHLFTISATISSQKPQQHGAPYTLNCHSTFLLAQRFWFSFGLSHYLKRTLLGNPVLQ